MKSLLEKYLSLVRDFLPAKKSKNSIGLDIGSHSCKAVELALKENGYELVNWAIEPCQNGGEAEAVKKILKKLAVEQKDVYTAVPNQGTLIRYLAMPRMPLEDLRSSILLEADKYFPFPKDQVYLDCFILDPKGKDSKMSVLIAAAKRETVDQRIQFLTDLGIQTQFIGLTAIALANAFCALKQNDKIPESQAVFLSPKEATALLDLGDTTSSLVIVKEFTLRFTRCIATAGRELNHRIANVLGISPREAEQIKSYPQGQLESVLSACESALVSLVSEIRLSFDYYTTENNAQIARLYLTGGSSLLEGIEKFFTAQLELPVERWNPLGTLQLSESISLEEVRKDMSKLTVALGLALQRND